MPHLVIKKVRGHLLKVILSILKKLPIIAMLSEEEEEVDEKENLNVQLLRKRKRDVAGGSNMSGSDSDKSPDS